jgi:hypothetical protein
MYLTLSLSYYEMKTVLKIFSPQDITSCIYFFTHTFIQYIFFACFLCARSRIWGSRCSVVNEVDMGQVTIKKSNIEQFNKPYEHEQECHLDRWPGCQISLVSYHILHMWIKWGNESSRSLSGEGSRQVGQERVGLRNLRSGGLWFEASLRQIVHKTLSQKNPS